MFSNKIDNSVLLTEDSFDDDKIKLPKSINTT